jgi:hypothetical protein
MFIPPSDGNNCAGNKNRLSCLGIIGNNQTTAHVILYINFKKSVNRNFKAV